MVQAIEGETFKGRELRLDGACYRRCRFEDCTLFFGGRDLPTLEFNTFERCSWIFDREAGNTLAFLQALYKGGGEAFVRDLLRSITGERPVA